MMKKIRKLLSVAIALSVFFAVDICSFAAPKQMADGTMFDAQFYAQTYADVANAVGTDEAALYNHYVNYGKAEGRKAYADAATSTPAATPAPASNSTTDRILALKASYPDGTPWNDSSSYTTSSTYSNSRSTATACQGFAYLVQDAAFGGGKSYKMHSTGLSSYIGKKIGAGKSYTLVIGNSSFIPTRTSYSSNDPEWAQVMASSNDHMWIPVYPDFTRIYDGTDSKVNANFEKIWNSLQVGDMVCDANHAAVVLTKGENSITVVEGNNNSQVKWGRYISKETLRVALYYVYSCQW